MPTLAPKQSILSRVDTKPPGGTLGGFTAGRPKNVGTPKIPSFQDVFGGTGSGTAAKPMTTVQNGQAMVMVNGKWVPQSSTAGQQALSGGGGGFAGGPGGGPASGPALQNYAQKDPRIEGTADALTKRRKALEAQEGQLDPFQMESIQNLRARMSADPTQRAIDRASSGAADWAAGMKERGAAAGARMGRGGGFATTGIEGAAQRLQAKQAADIALGRERDLDALTIQGNQILQAPSQYGLARQGLTQGAYGQEAGFAPTGANLGLAQQRLGLDQYLGAGELDYKQALLQQQGLGNQMDLYMKMLSLAGY